MPESYEHVFYDALGAHDAYLRDLLVVAWWTKRAGGLTKEHILQRPRAIDVMWRKEIGLEQWQLEESRKMTKRVFAEFGHSLVPRPTTFITSPNV